jgi:superfamily II DNA or RNA helicase/diadenosine tetraphosphate (Ap4A) HIT family hydrolase
MRHSPAVSIFLALPQSSWVASNTLAFAVRDAFPVSPGHTLVITRRLVPDWFAATEEERVAVMALVQEVKQALDAISPRPDGYNVGFNAGEAAGQTLLHLHVHVIPRFRGDMGDPRGGVRGVIPSKQNYLPVAAASKDKPFAALPAFVHGDDLHFEHALRAAMLVADRADILSAFLQTSGVHVLFDDLRDALQRGTRIRLLTGDYLGISSADALRTLLRLADEHPSFSPFFYETEGGTSFHPKSYMFFQGPHGVAYVGSSNLSRSALQEAVEWNLRLISSDDEATFAAVTGRFEALLASPRTKPLTRALVDAYEARAPVPQAPLPEPRLSVPTPNEIQLEALDALKKTRRAGHTKGLVVLATGVGKTLLAAFDAKAMGSERVLFVAHREEILGQAKDNWQRVFPDKVVGTYQGGTHERDADLLFASVQTLSRASHLSQFTPEHFDYIVIDEFHHAAASTYRKILGHFRPRFLLALTATPERMDGRSLLDLCGDNLVYRRDLVHGISRRLLVPFHYFGVKDDVDFEPIPWRSGKFDAAVLTTAVATEARAEHALAEYEKRAGSGIRRTLCFCCTVEHADFMAAFFRRRGKTAQAVHSGPTSASRANSLRELAAGTLEFVCAVDVFNEGLDVPDVNSVLMLRPTESPVIFLQQLGRGLRLAAGKTSLVVIDFIGNHRSFLTKPQSLLFLLGQ